MDFESVDPGSNPGGAIENFDLAQIIKVHNKGFE